MNNIQGIRSICFQLNMYLEIYSWNQAEGFPGLSPGELSGGMGGARRI